MDDRPAFDATMIAEAMELHRLAGWPAAVAEALELHRLAESPCVAAADLVEQVVMEPFRRAACEAVAALAADLAGVSGGLPASSLDDGFSRGRPESLGGIARRQMRPPGPNPGDN